MNASPSPYPAYKPSGLEWFGDVPADWVVRRLRNVVDMRVSNVDKHVKDDEMPVRLCNYVDVYKNDCINGQKDFMWATATHGEIERFRLEKDDVLITKDSETWDDIGVPALVTEPASDLISGYHLALLRPRPDVLAGAWLLRALQSKGLAYQFHVEAKGVTRYGLSHAGIKSVWLPVPPLPEQTSIVRFLDHADRRIRRYIRAKQKLIALLEEQKQAIIHQAVTGQIDVRTGQPYPAYKPSGVEWLRDVPAHWSISRLKTLVSRIDQGVSPQAENHLAIGMAWGVLKAGCVNGGVFKETEHKRLMPEFKFDPMLSVSFGDVLISRASGSPRLVGSVGRVAVLRYRLILSDKTFRPIFTERVDPDFMVLAMNDRNYRQQVEQAISGAEGLANNLPLSSLRAFRFVVPSLEEQGAIVCCLRETTSELSAAATRSEAEIALLHEYRARLIADVVTGKMDVREAATSLPDMDPLAAEDSLDGTLETVAGRNFHGFDATLGETGHRES